MLILSACGDVLATGIGYTPLGLVILPNQGRPRRRVGWASKYHLEIRCAVRFSLCPLTSAVRPRIHPSSSDTSIAPPGSRGQRRAFYFACSLET